MNKINSNNKVLDKLAKNNITEEQFKWFADKLDDSFELNLTEKSQVIFGFNGIGKSTIYKILKFKEPNNIEF